MLSSGLLVAAGLHQHDAADDDGDADRDHHREGLSEQHAAQDRGGRDSRTDEALRPIAQADRARSIDMVAAVLERWHPEMSAVGWQEWARAVLAVVDGLTEGWLTDRDDRALDRASRRLIASLVSGMLERT